VIKNTRRAGGNMLTAVNLSTSTALVLSKWMVILNRTEVS